MHLSRHLLRVAVLGGLLLSTGCGALLYDDGCGPETRETSVGGEVRDAAGTRLGTAAFRLVEVRGGAQPRSLHPVVMGPAYGSAGAPLRGHVTAARLVGPGGATLFELSVAPGLGDEVLRTTPVPIPDEAAFAALKQEFRAGRVVLDLRTDLAGREQIRVPLALGQAGGWTRAHCS
jgi:hypothetical protein